MRLLAALSLIVVTICCTPSLARADSYEWQRMNRVLSANGWELASLPEDKKIAWIRIVSDDVFVKDEIWPLFLNWFHMTTREATVRRELLFAENGPYHEARIEETMRNLRSMGIFALVRIVAVKTDKPDEVGVVVHTRDLWSLRLETAFLTTTIVDNFKLNLTERNLFGRNKMVAVEFDYLPRNFSLSESYVARRVWGSTVQFGETAGIILNDKTRKTEGSLWEFSLGEPYYNLKQKFAWQSSFTYADSIIRNLQKRSLVPFYTSAPNIEDGERFYSYRVYRRLRGTGSLLGYIRFGEFFKQTWGAGWDYRGLKAHATSETMLDPRVADFYEQQVLPRQRTESGPAFTYNILMPEFVRFQNLATYGQTENVRVGPSATVTSRLPLKSLGSNSDSWVFTTQVGYILAPKGGLLEFSVAGQTRYENQRMVDQRLDALVRGATPVLFKLFRAVARVTWTGRRNDTANTFVGLGAADGLRGYTSNQITGIGASSLLCNFELRTLPVQWQGVQLGGVAFWDAGTVYNAAADLRMHYAVGLGIRILIPQLNRTPFSLDAAGRLDPPFRIVPTVTGGQVVPLTAAEDPQQ